MISTYFDIHIGLRFPCEYIDLFFISDTYTSFVFYSRGKKTQLASILSPPTEEPPTSTQVDRSESGDEESMGFFSEDVSLLLLLMESLE